MAKLLRSSKETGVRLKANHPEGSAIFGILKISHVSRGAFAPYSNLRRNRWSHEATEAAKSDRGQSVAHETRRGCRGLFLFHKGLGDNSGGRDLADIPRR